MSAGALVAGLLHHSRHAWLYDLVVDHDYRGEGYGRDLVERVEAWALEEDCDYVALASPLATAETHDFYRRSRASVSGSFGRPPVFRDDETPSASRTT